MVKKIVNSIKPVVFLFVYFFYKLNLFITNIKNDIINKEIYLPSKSGACVEGRERQFTYK